MKTFIESHFGYCPLVLMFHSRTLNNKINHFHERALRIVYRNYVCSCKGLLTMDQLFTIPQITIQSLAIELFKLKQNISTHMMSNIFQMKDNLIFNLRSQTEFLRSSANSCQYGLNSLRVCSSKVWSMVPNKIKNSATLNIF